MKAWQLKAFDGPEALELVETDEPRTGEEAALVDIHAIGVNFPDLLATKGEYQHRPDLPFVPGCEVAGTVREAPAGSRFEAGDRVAAFVWDGGFAEVASVPVRALTRLVDGMDFSVGAATIVNYQTVHFGLSRRADLRPGETAAILGAGGGIGSAAVQVAKGLGARVIAGVADESQAATAAEAGADEVLVLAEGFSRQLIAFTDGRGVDLVLDPLGDWLFVEGVRALAPEGRILVVGFAAGEIPNLRVNRLLLKNVSAIGVGWGAFLDVDPSVVETGAEAMSDFFRRGILHPPIGGRFTFDQVPEALSKLERHEIHGKGVVEVAPGP